MLHTDSITKIRLCHTLNQNKVSPEKIQYFLKKDYNIKISVSTIYRILNKKYQLKSKWKKNCKRGHVKKGEEPRESIQTYMLILEVSTHLQL